MFILVKEVTKNIIYTVYNIAFYVLQDRKGIASSAKTNLITMKLSFFYSCKNVGKNTSCNDHNCKQESHKFKLIFSQYSTSGAERESAAF